MKKLIKCWEDKCNCVYGCKKDDGSIKLCDYCIEIDKCDRTLAADNFITGICPDHRAARRIIQTTTER